MTKHQGESAPDGAKQRLFSAMEMLYRYTPRDTSQAAQEQMNEAKAAMISDYLKVLSFSHLNLSISIVLSIPCRNSYQKAN